MCAKSKIPKLFVELVPSTCHFSNVRTTVKPSEWDIIRFISYEAAGNKCEICGGTGKEQGYKHNVECHEIWEYDDENFMQKLVGLISLCPTCHQVKHIGRAIAIGKQTECFIQLAKVNKWTQKEIDDHIISSFELHKQRSKNKWDLDISLLEKTPYNIKLKPMKERVFEVKKYKKKPKKKAVAGAPKNKKIHPKAKMAAVLKPMSSLNNKRPPKK
jgi:hypothetical protein